MPKGAKKPTAKSYQNISHARHLLRSIGSPTHEGPVSPEEVLGQRVEGNVGARTLGIVVRGRELSASGGETTASNEVGGHSGPDSSSGVHLRRESDAIDYRRKQCSTTNLEYRSRECSTYATVVGKGREERVERDASSSGPRWSRA